MAKLIEDQTLNSAIIKATQDLTAVHLRNIKSALSGVYPFLSNPSKAKLKRHFKLLNESAEALANEAIDQCKKRFQ